MSFSRDIKKELARIDLNQSSAKAQLAALILGNGSMLIRDKQFHIKGVFTQAFVAKRFVTLMKQVYQVSCQLSHHRRHNLNKEYIYTTQISQKAKLILEDLGFWKSTIGLSKKVSRRLLLSSDTKRAYIAGWFLAKGSMNDPNSSDYHLEFRIDDQELAIEVLELFKQVNIPFKHTRRRQKFLIYLKLSDKIGDVLRFMGAHQSLLYFEEKRIGRDFRNSLTRLNNCELANEMKTIQAGLKQIEVINWLIDSHRLEYLDTKLQQIAQLRLQAPEASLLELSALMKQHYNIELSKSGIKHRLDKLMSLFGKEE